MENAANIPSYSTLHKTVLRAANVCRLDIVQRDDHPQSVKLFCDIAKQFGIDVTDRDETYWRAILNTSREFDTLVDDDKVQDIRPFLDNLTHGRTIQGFSQFQAEEFAMVYASLDKNRQSVIDKSIEMVDFARARYTAQTIDEFVDVTVEEAEYFAKLVTIDENSECEDIAARERFNTWLPRLGRAGYLLDSVSDASSDYENEIISIRPTIKTQMALGRLAAAELKGCLANAPVLTGPILFRAGFEKAIRGALKISQ